MRTVYLYGDLAELFTDKIDLEVKSIHETIRALSANFPNFANYMLEHKPGFHIKVEDILREEATIEEPIGNKDIHLIPVVAGSGKLGMIIAGAFLIYMTAGAATGAVLGSSTFAGTTAGSFWLGSTGAISASVAASLGQIGIGLVMAGISAVLFAPPKPKVQTPTENTPNTYFNGSVNTIAQGLPVPIGYGELIIGSAIVSATVSIDSTAGTKKYEWSFPASGTAGWTLISGTTYQSNSLDIKYNSNLGEYTWDEVTIIPSYLDYDGSGNYIEYPESTRTRVFTYSEYTGRFKSPPVQFAIGSITKRFNATYGSATGSDIIPEGWGS